MRLQYAWAGVFLVTGVLCGCTDDSGEKPAVVVYCSVDQSLAEEVFAAFEAKTGIIVRARYDTEAAKTVGLVQRLRAESSHPAADVFWSSEVFHTIRLAREGLLAPYEADAVADWPAAYVERRPGGAAPRWYGFALRARVICTNTRRVSPDEAPGRLEDLLDPRWKGRLVMAAPQFGTTSGDIASWFCHYGPARATQILRGLKANGMRTVDGNATAVRMVATGQADVCLTDTDDVHAGVRNGWPVAMRLLNQNGDGALVIPNTAALVAGGPNSDKARVLMAFLLSEAAERIIARSDSHNSPVHASLAREFAQYAVASPLTVDYAAIADALPQAVGAAGDILR